jgi:hypothetical protein
MSLTVLALSSDVEEGGWYGREEGEVVGAGLTTGTTDGVEVEMVPEEEPPLMPPNDTPPSPPPPELAAVVVKVFSGEVEDVPSLLMTT